MTNEQKTTYTKEAIVNAFNSLVNESFDSLCKVLSSIDDAKKDLTSITLEYSKVSQEIVKSKGELEVQRNELTRANNKLIEDIQNFKSEVERFENTKLKIKRDVELLTTAKTKLEQDIKYCTESLDTMAMQLKSKDILSKELEDVRIALQKETKDLNTVKEEYNTVLRKTTKAIEDEKSILETIKKDIEEKRKIVIPTIEELDIRAKALDEKEEGLKIIEARYKKLYGEHGANFKV